VARAVASGYLDYKNCTLQGKQLLTLETWAISQVRTDEARFLRSTRLSMDTTLATTTPKACSEMLESIQGLWGSIYNGIVGTEEKIIERSADQRYKAAFGDVSELDIAKLNEHLGDKTLADKQRAKSKDEALKVLENELEKRFRSRIK